MRLRLWNIWSSLAVALAVAAQVETGQAAAVPVVIALHLGFQLRLALR